MLTFVANVTYIADSIRGIICVRFRRGENPVKRLSIGPTRIGTSRIPRIYWHTNRGKQGCGACVLRRTTVAGWRERVRAA
jgi:hypothetical protein